MTRTRFLLVLSTLAFIPLLAFQVEAAKGQLTDQEKYVFHQVGVGEVADLKTRFGKMEEVRTLSASFIKELITGGHKVHWKGVRIKNAVVTEPLDLEMAEVPHTVELIDCKFQEQVNCLHTVFEKHLILNGSRFEKEGNFQRINIKKNFFSVHSTFQGPVDFRSANIAGLFIADGARFQNGKVDTIFNGLKVGQSAFFINATFNGPVDFTTAEIGGQFAANGVQFLSQENLVKFNAIKVGRDAFFEYAIFKGPVDFGCAEISRYFSIKGAQFLNKEQLANFNSIKVGQHAVLKGATFHGQVDFGGTEIGNQFIVDEAKFLNPEKEANFGYLKVGKSAFFDKATFHGQAYFDSAEINWHFSANEVRFLKQEEIS